jgi:hypothetical protein
MPAMRTAAAVQNWQRSGEPGARGRGWLTETVYPSSPTIARRGSARSMRRARSWSRRRQGRERRSS